MPNAQRSDNETFPWAFDLGDRLDKALRVAGVSTAEMADTLDVSRNTIGNYTSGRTRPSRLQIREWAARTGAPVQWLETGMVGPAGIEPTTSTV
ncbi:helix-turn-helix domain-containing protein [Microbacterium sp. NPDC007973]|uniref:helix-turn-helix domain-containing protein n=1 Tax=Microbacterium sp. NPDC007973 TaxID=3364182 RepID=UPI0036E3CF26